MRVEPTSPPSEFPAFCLAVRMWLRDSAFLDPSLVAAADLVEGVPLAEVEELADLAVNAADVHGVLGATALLSLWSGLPR